MRLRQRQAHQGGAPQLRRAAPDLPRAARRVQALPSRCLESGGRCPCARRSVRGRWTAGGQLSSGTRCRAVRRPFACRSFSVHLYRHRTAASEASNASRASAVRTVTDTDAMTCRRRVEQRTCVTHATRSWLARGRTMAALRVLPTVAPLRGRREAAGGSACTPQCSAVACMRAQAPATPRSARFNAAGRRTRFLVAASDVRSRFATGGAWHGTRRQHSRYACTALQRQVEDWEPLETPRSPPARLPQPLPPLPPPPPLARSGMSDTVKAAGACCGCSPRRCVLTVHPPAAAAAAAVLLLFAAREFTSDSTRLWSQVMPVRDGEAGACSGWRPAARAFHSCVWSRSRHRSLPQGRQHDGHRQRALRPARFRARRVQDFPAAVHAADMQLGIQTHKATSCSPMRKATCTSRWRSLVPPSCIASEEWTT